MRNNDRLQHLLLEFFNLPPDTLPREINQKAVAAWDSLAMVQLISELQGTFSIEFDLEEIDALRSYDEIRHSLLKKGVSLNRTTA